MDTISKIIKLLNDSNIEQNELCAYLNVKPQVFSDWKAGRNSSYNKHIAKIAEFFNVSTDYLLGNTEQQDAKQDDSNVRDLDKILKDLMMSRNSLAFNGDILNLDDETKELLIASLENS